MKKVIILFLFAPLFLLAQQNERINNLNIGLQAGLNFSNYLNPIHFKNDSLFQPHRAALPLVGANITLPFNNFLNLRIGALYSMKSTNYIAPVSCKIRYSYFDFPTIIQIKPGNFLRFEAGALTSVNLSSEALYALGDSVVQIPKNGSGMEVAIHLGAEVTLQKGIDIGFSYEIPTKSSCFNNFRFTLTYSFNLNAFANTPKVKDDIAYQQIINMRNNAILVRLKTSEKQINALKSMGRDADAEKILKKQREINMEIMNAFKSNFNFCPVFFFYSPSSNSIRHNDYIGHLLNDSLIADTTVKCKFTNAYIAEFGFIESDTNYIDRELYKQQYYQLDSALYLTSTNSTEALIIRNSNFVQLEEPFPYYVEMEEWTVRKTYAMAVRIMNEQLHRFFVQTSKFQNK